LVKESPPSKSHIRYWCHMPDFVAPEYVIPAKAGIHAVNRWEGVFRVLDSRLRGNDRVERMVPLQMVSLRQGCVTQIKARLSRAGLP
jgi:hypothetical protein